MVFTLLNMCEIYDPKEDRVLVLDKVKKQGWEGWTYPGGHVECGESLLSAVCREVREETALTIHNPQYVGTVHWVTESIGEHLVAHLYRATEFEGTLCPENREGRLWWMPREEFLRSASFFAQNMEEILSIYRGEYREIVFYCSQTETERFFVERCEKYGGRTETETR